MKFFLGALICDGLVTLTAGILYLFVQFLSQGNIPTAPAGILSIILFCICVLVFPALIVSLIISTMKTKQENSLMPEEQERAARENRSVFQKIKLIKAAGVPVPASVIWLLILSLLSLLAALLGGLLLALGIGGILMGYALLLGFADGYFGGCVALFHSGMLLFLLFPHLIIIFFQLAHKYANTKLLTLG